MTFSSFSHDFSVAFFYFLFYFCMTFSSFTSFSHDFSVAFFFFFFFF